MSKVCYFNEKTRIKNIDKKQIVLIMKSIIVSERTYLNIVNKNFIGTFNGS